MTSHIRIPDISPVVQSVADGTKSVFSFPFPIFKAGDLEVRANNTLVTTGYSVVGEGSSTGGAVIFTAAPANGVRVTLRRKQTYARTDDFLDERAPTPHELNDAVDQNVAAIQELAEQVSRSVKRPLSADLSQPVDLSLPVPEAGKVIGWNPLGDRLVNLNTQTDIPVGKVQLNKDDSPDYLQAKLAAGNHIGLSIDADKMRIDVTGLGTAATLNVGTAANQVVQLDGAGKVPSAVLPAESGMVKVDGADDADYLENQLQAGNNITVAKTAGKMRIDVTGLGTAAYQNIGTSGANVPLLNAANTYGAPQTPAAQVLTDADTVNIPITSQVWTLATTASRTIGAPTGGVENTFYFLKIVTNGFTPTWNTAFDFGAAKAPANLSGTCGFDIFYDGSKYRISTRFTGGA